MNSELLLQNNQSAVACNVDNISVTIYSSFAELENLQKEWDDFVESVNGDIYLTFDWCRIWWQHYGVGRRLYVFIFRDDRNIVGIVPLFTDCIRLGLIRLRIAKMVGADFTMEIVTLPLCQEYSKAIIGHVNSYLLGSNCCDVVYWGPLSGIHYTAQAIEDGLEDHKEFYKLIRKNILGSYTLYPLPKTYELYFNSLSKSTRKHHRRGCEALAVEYDIKYKLAESCDSAFDEFLEMHEVQWKNVNKLGHFGDWPDARAFHKDLVTAHSRLGRLRLFCLYADGKPVVYRYVYRFGKRYHSFLPARICGLKWDKYGLGQLAHILTVEKAIKEGVMEIDAGRGHYDHKLRLGGQEYPVFSLLISKNIFSSVIRASFFFLFSEILHFCYYRIWFNRLAPKLPFKRRPLWKLWIRTRL